MMNAQFLGIDFSGGAPPWRERVSRPTVWVAGAELGSGKLKLVSLKPVQDLPGPGDRFARLVALLRSGKYVAASIDAPFSIPASHIPEGGHKALLDLVAALPNANDRPFPRGGDLVALAERACTKATPKPLRGCESYWVKRRVNARSTLWNGPRGGAPFAAACLALIARSQRPCWPWYRTTHGLLVEAFPAAQLRQWNLPHQGYSGPAGAALRHQITASITQRIEIPDAYLPLISASPDALDAVIAIFSGVAVSSGALASAAPDENHEGWIAVHA
jgi:hypothetical protein